MAIVQISRITHRKGLIENLPQLAGGEFGWAVDDRRLFIGNGTLAEGAPVVGNTEILTEYSDILNLASTYTYAGEEAGYRVQTGSTLTNNIVRTLQEKFDDIASVKDFGAIGDGEADDTVAINRALYQLFCREVNEEVRRSLYFPAGVYKVSGTIKIPPYAKIYGEGANSSIIRYISIDGSTVDSCVVCTADSLQQTGANIGNNAAISPRNIEVSSMSFETEEEMDVLLVEKTSQSYFESVNFKGNTPQAELSDPLEDTACIRVVSSTNYETTHVTFEKCQTSNTTYAFFTNYNCTGIVLSNNYFHTHFKGVVLGLSPINAGPRGVKVVHNLFDNISAQGIEIGAVALNSSGFNTFLDVGNDFDGLGNPSSVVVDINAANNLSIGDLFERNDVDNATVKRIDLNDTDSIALDSTSGIKFGRTELGIGYETTLADNISSPTSIFSLMSTNARSYTILYSVRRGDAVRTGEILATVGYGGNTPTFVEDYTESATTGVVFTVSQVGTDLSFNYTTTSTGTSAEFTYQITKFLV